MNEYYTQYWETWSVFYGNFFLLFNNKLYFVGFRARALGQWHMHNLLEREVVGELM